MLRYTTDEIKQVEIKTAVDILNYPTYGAYAVGVSEPVITSLCLCRGDVNLFAEVPGTGLTDLIYGMAVAVATDAKFLGDWVSSGKVLFIQTRDSIQSMVESLELYKMTKEQAANIIFERNFDMQYNLSDLNALLNQHKPQLLIIDSLSSSTRAGRAKNRDKPLADYIYDLRDVVQQHQATTVITHHYDPVLSDGIRYKPIIDADLVAASDSCYTIALSEPLAGRCCVSDEVRTVSNYGLRETCKFSVDVYHDSDFPGWSEVPTKK